MIQKGYDILVIWESEYKKDKIILKCLDFIYDKENK